MPPVVKSIELASGGRIEYAEQGDPAGTPMVLLHGVTDSRRSFDPVLPHLPEWIHAFAVTQRGHGDSGRPASGYRTRDFAADVAAFVDAVELEPPIVVGHSMGGTNAQRFAIDFTDRLSGLVLAGTFASYRDNPVVNEFWETAVSQLNDPIDPAFVREFQVSTLAQPVSEEFLETVVRESLKLPARVWRDVFTGFMQDEHADRLGRIEAPTLILWGAKDTFCPRSDQEALLAAIRGSRLVTYEHAGHALHWEEPMRFAADLAAFAETVAR